MSVYRALQKQKYRVTLEIEALDDFDPHQIDWNKYQQSCHPFTIPGNPFQYNKLLYGYRFT